MNDVPLSVDRLYADTCSSIRATDEISFKLMGFVPLVSGAGLLTLFLKEPIPSENSPIVAALALFAAVITLGLFRWELRNIQTCSWLRRRAEALEEALVKTSGAPKQPKPPSRIGKTEAEKSIYSITIFAWLIMPTMLISPLDKLSWLLPVYAVVAVVIAIVTALSALGSVRVAKGGFMYHVAAYFDVKPEHRDEFITAALEDGRDSAANEPGTKRFELIVDENDPNRFYLNEGYDSLEAFNAHAEGKYYKKFFKIITPLVEGGTPTTLIRGNRYEPPAAN